MFESFFKKIKKIDARDEKKDLVYDSVSGIIFKKSLTQRIQNSKHVKFVSKHSLFLAIGILLLIAIVQFTPFNSSSFASTTRFYSSSCLGGWQNTNHVQGEPDAPQLETGPGFSSQNSAILTDAVSTLFCGGFSGNIPKDSKPKKVIVSFSWGTTPLESTSNASSSSVIDGSATSSSLQLLDTPASEHPTVLSGNATSSDQTSSEDKPKENSSSDSTPSSDTNSSGSTPKPSETSSPSSAPASEPTPTSAPAPTPNEPTPASAPAASEPAPAPAPSPAPEAFNNLLISHVFADEISSSTSGGFLKVSYTDNGKDWHELGVVNRNNLNNVSFEIPQNVVSQWSDVNKIQVSVESLPTVDSQPTVYLDSMWLEVEYDRIATISDAEIKYLPRVEVGDTNIFDQTQKDFQSNENPEFEINLENESASSTNSLTNSSTNQNVQSSSDTGSSTVSTSTPVSFIGKLQNLLTYFAPSKVFAQDFSKKKVLKAELFSPDGTLYKDQPIIEEQNGKAIVTVPHHSKSFRPGKYQLRIEVLSDNKVLTTTRDFGWGVLAINTDKSSYEKKDDVYLQIGALTSEGHTMCNASLELVVTNPKGKTAIFSTADETIKKSVTCAKDNVTDNPDYFLHYKTTVTGVYSMTLKNKDNGFEVSDTFEVNPQARFVVERIGATRINPFASDYVMNIKVTATEDFDGTINELIPTDFDILSTTPSADVVDVSEGKKISWTKHIAAGETINLSYDYRAAQISPELFLLGPITFETTNGTVGQEPRAWQLASDAACNAITTGNWNDGTKFSGCTGTAGVPAAADTVTINSGVIMTITADATTSAITVAANASGVTGNGITINSGINFAVTEQLP